MAAITNQYQAQKARSGYRQLIREILQHSVGQLRHLKRSRPSAKLGGDMQLSFLDHKYARLVRICIKIHAWLGKNPHWDMCHEPPWYQEFRSALLEITQYEDEDDPKLTRKGEWISL